MRWLLARLVFWPTLAWNALLARVFGVIRWWDRIDEHVILGALPVARDVAALQREGVVAVVNTCEEAAGPWRQYERAGVTQLRLPIVDYAPPTLQDVTRAVEFIRRYANRGQSVYVHCKAGRGRSATIAVCWLMASANLSPEEAQAAVRQKRPQVIRSLARRQVVRDFQSRLQESRPPGD